MTIGDWTYYNHGWLPTCAPHQMPDTTPLTNGELFKNGGVLARYTTEYDCGYETEWWYVILDKPFNISELTSNWRYKIRKGEKNFYVKRIDPRQYKEQLFYVAKEAFASYPIKYRPILDKEKFCKEIDDWDGIIYAAFENRGGEIVGYSIIQEDETAKYAGLTVQKTVPSYEKLQVNAALVYKILQDYHDKLSNGWYICDGARNILHETNFQEYLQKYFLFRKAYCKLHVEYAPKYKFLVKALYPFRRMAKKFDFIGKVHQLNGVLAMEEIIRRQIT